MNEIHAVVRRLGDGCVWVETDPASSCSRCQGGKARSTVSISRLFCSPSRQFKLAVTEPLQLGDVVRLGMRDDKILQAALLAYGLPVLGLMAGAWVGSIVAPTREAISIVCGVAGFLGGLVAVRYSGARVPAPSLMGKVHGSVITIARADN